MFGRVVQFCALLLLLWLPVLVQSPRVQLLKVPPRLKPLPPPPQPTAIRMLIYATINNVDAEQKEATNDQQAKTNSPERIIAHIAAPQTPRVRIHRAHWHHRSSQKRRHKLKPTAVVDSFEEETARMVAQLLAQLKREEAAEMAQLDAQEEDEELVTVWQLFSACSGGFVRAQGAKVSADGRANGADQCETLFVPEPVLSGGLQLRHAKSGRLLCVGKRRGGAVAVRRTGFASECRFREHLAPSGHISLRSVLRPLGFSHSGRPLTSSNDKRGRGGPKRRQRCFLFTKLVSQRHRADPCGDVRARKVRAGDDEALRQMAREALLEQVEAREEGQQSLNSNLSLI